MSPCKSFSSCLTCSLRDGEAGNGHWKARGLHLTAEWLWPAVPAVTRWPLSRTALHVARAALWRPCALNTLQTKIHRLSQQWKSLIINILTRDLFLSPSTTVKMNGSKNKVQTTCLLSKIPFAMKLKIQNIIMGYDYTTCYHHRSHKVVWHLKEKALPPFALTYISISILYILKSGEFVCTCSVCTSVIDECNTNPLQHSLEKFSTSM